MRYVKSGTAAIIAGVICAGAGTAKAASRLTITEVQHHTRQPTEVADCRNDDGICTIERGHTFSASINSNFGVTVKALSAAIGREYQESYTDQTGCSNTHLDKGERLVMYPSGDFVFFEQDGEKGTAFLPTGIDCIIESDW